MFSIYDLFSALIFFLLGAITVLTIYLFDDIKRPATQLWAGKVPCKICKGSGRLANQEKCKACDGKGVVLVYLNMEGKPVECPHCADLRAKDKAGYFKLAYGCGSPDFFSCNICKGTGWLGRIWEDAVICFISHKVLIECPECMGKGKIDTGETDVGYSSNPSSVYEECKLCDSTGWIFAHLDEKGNIKYCDWCHGPGEYVIDPGTYCSVCGGKQKNTD